MKRLIIIFLAIPFIGLSQLTDTTCLEARWIALKPTANHAAIFGLDSTLNEELDLIHVIHFLVEKNKLSLYNQNTGPNGTMDWNWIDFQKELQEAEQDSVNFENWKPYFTLYGPQSDVPLTDEYGEPLVIPTPDGFEAYVYPPRDVYYYPTKEVDEIRIKEKRTINEKTGAVEFKPVGLSFYFKGSRYYRGHEAFWIDLTELKSVLGKDTKYPWFSPIFDQKYNGFQYMQISCSDVEIKY